MCVDQQARYPKATYKIQFSKSSGEAENYITNIHTGIHFSSSSLWDLIKIIQMDISKNIYPQSTICLHTWSNVPASDYSGNLVPMNSHLNSITKPISLTIIIQVIYCQNATWQGTIRWIEGKQVRQYRSINELLMLVDEALNITGDSDELDVI